MEKENLRPEDLMVWDWVLLWGDKPARVDCIGNVEVYLSEPMGQHELDWKVTYEHIKPIPLTPEILEKNGFEKQSNYQWKYRGNSCKIVISIAPQIEIDGEIIGTQPINIMLEGALFTMNITSDCYVHDLQHIIRLAGIDKEVVL